MAVKENPPFQRGQTFYGPDGLINTADVNFYNNSNLEGKEWEFDDLAPTPSNVAGGGPSTPALLRTSRTVICRCVRNVASINLLPSRMANMQIAGADGRYQAGRVDGYANVLAQRAFPIDEFLPAAGVRPNDLFWIVTQGPAIVQTDLTTLSVNVNVGDGVVNGTFATSTNTTSGGLVVPFTINAGTTANSSNADQIRNQLGRALSAATTGQTGTSLLIDVGHW